MDGNILNAVTSAVGQGLQEASQYSAKAAARANGVSAAAQSAQGSFNQGSANNANAIGTDRLAQLYGFNSAQASYANDFTQQMWNQAAGWNEEMFERQMEFNAEQARLNREWQERMDSTKYQRAIGDMEKAGLNPVLAVTGGGISAGSGSGSAASVSAPSMGGASGQMASGGLLQGVSASEGNYTGQMEYMAGMLGLLSAGMSGLTAAIKCFDQAGLGYNNSRNNYNFADFISDLIRGDARQINNPNTKYNQIKQKAKEAKDALSYYKQRFTNPELYK